MLPPALVSASHCSCCPGCSHVAVAALPVLGLPLLGCRGVRGLASIFPPFTVRPVNELYSLGLFFLEKNRKSWNRKKYPTVFLFSLFCDPE